MRLLDLFCCQGGAAMGYHRAGFDVVGVDVTPQPRYPFKFVQADAFEYLAEHGFDFDAIHASPPCQGYSMAERINDSADRFPRWVDALRFQLRGMFYDNYVGWRTPYVIENVPGAPLLGYQELCGAMFGLGTYRHRLFETNWPLEVPGHPAHIARTAKMGRPPAAGEMMHVVGNFSDVAQAKKAMGIDWMTRDGLRESIPPAYTEHIGHQLAAHIAAESTNRMKEAA